MSVQLGLFDEALQDAEKGRALAKARLKITRKSIPGYVKTFLRKGAALNGIQPSRVHLRVVGTSSIQDHRSIALINKQDVFLEASLLLCISGAIKPFACKIENRSSRLRLSRAEFIANLKMGVSRWQTIS